jgi:hypothetical protein
LLAAEFYNRRLSLFTVDGVFAKHIGANALSAYDKDVSFGAGGEILVAEQVNHRIRVFSPDGDTVIKAWAAWGTTAGKFTYPKTLAVSGSYLFVMDITRVHVFE